MLYLERFLRAKDTYGANALVQEQMRHKLISILLSQHRLNFKDVFEFGAGNGELTHMLKEIIVYQSYICNDILDYKVNLNNFPHMQYHVFDMTSLADTFLWEMQFELIVSNACLQWLEFEKTLCNLKHILAPDGWCLLSTFGERNYHEVKSITNYGLDYVDLHTIKQILSEHFEILYFADEVFTLDFPTPLEVFRHLKLSGVNALHREGYISRAMLSRYENVFKNKLTYHPIYMLLSHKSTTLKFFCKS